MADCYRPARRDSREQDTRSRYRHDSRFDRVPTGPRGSRPSERSRSYSYGDNSMMQLDEPAASAENTPGESPRSPVSHPPGMSRTPSGRPADPRKLNRYPLMPISVDSKSSTSQKNDTFDASLAGPRPSGTSADGQGSDSLNTPFQQWLKQLVKHSVLDDRLEQAELRLTEIEQEQQQLRTTFPDHPLLHNQLSARHSKHEQVVRQLRTQVENSRSNAFNFVSSMNEHQQNLVRGVPPNMTANPSTRDPAVATLVEKFEELQRRYDAQQQEIQQLKQNNIPKEFLEGKINQHKIEVDRAINTVNKQLENHVESIVSLQQGVEGLRGSLDEQKASVAQLMPKVNGIVDTHAHTTILAGADLAELKQSCREHELELANLSNVFASQAAYKSLLEEVRQLNTSKQETAAKLETLMNGSANIAGMKATIDRLASFEGHYRTFYENTEANIQRHDKDIKMIYTHTAELASQHRQLDLKQNEHQKSTNASLKKQEDVVNGLQKNSISPSDQITRLFTLLNEVTQKLAQVEEKYHASTKEVESTLKQKVETYFLAHFDQLKGEINAIRPIVSSNSHAIRNLNTRYESISTQKLYQAIVSTLTPLGPLCDQVRDEHNGLLTKMLQLENASSQLRSDLVAARDASNGRSSDLQTKVDQLCTRVDALIQHNWGSDHPVTGNRRPDVQRDVDDLKRELNELKAKSQSDVQISQQCNDFVQTLSGLDGRLRRVESDALAAKDQTRMDSLDESLSELHDRLATTDSRESELRNDVQRLKTSIRQIPALMTSDENLLGRLNALEGLGLARLQETVSNVILRLEAIESECASGLEVRHDIQALRQTLTEHQRLIESFAGAVQPHRQERHVDLRMPVMHRSGASANTAVGRHVQLGNLLKELYLLVSQFRALRLALEDSFPHLVLPPAAYNLLRFIKISNLASKVNENEILRKLEVTKIRHIWFRGAKIEPSKKTTRFALLQIQINTEDEVAELIASYNGKDWHGRRIDVKEADDDTIDAVLFGMSLAEWSPSAALTPLMNPSTSSVDSDTIVVNTAATADAERLRTGSQGPDSRRRRGASHATDSTLGPSSPRHGAMSAIQHPLASAGQDSLNGWGARTSLAGSPLRNSFPLPTRTGSSQSSRTGASGNLGTPSRASISLKRAADQISRQNSLEVKGASAKKGRKES